MAFLRFSRDKRGYEHFYLLEPTGRHDKSRTKILYWFRTPPGVRVGRPPFDEPLKRALREQYPGVAFDWKKFESTPIPPVTPDVEHWRERRKAERAAKQAARQEAEAEAAEKASEDKDAAETVASPQSSVASPVEGAGVQDAGRRKRRRRRRGGRYDGGPVVQVVTAESGEPSEPSEPGEP